MTLSKISLCTNVARKIKSFLNCYIPVNPQWSAPPSPKADPVWFKRVLLQLTLGLFLFLSIQGFLSRRYNELASAITSGADVKFWHAFALLSVLAVLPGYWVLVRVAGGRPVIELAGRGAGFREFCVGFVVGALIVGAVIVILFAVGCYRVKDVGWNVGVIGGAWAGLYAGVIEEIFYRGFLLQIMENILGSWLSLGVASIFFGLSHLSNKNMTVIGAVAIALEAGILLGACYLLTRRLWLAIGVHVAWNFVQGGIFGSDISGTGSGRGLIEARFTGPDLLTGGVMGIEGSVVTFVLGTATGLAMLLAVRQRGLVVPPDS